MTEYSILFILRKEYTYWWCAKVEIGLIPQQKLIWKWIWNLKVEKLSLHFLFFIYFVVKEKLPGNTLCQDPTWIHSDSFWEQTQNLLLRGVATASTVTHFNLQISSSLLPLSQPNKLTKFKKNLKQKPAWSRALTFKLGKARPWNPVCVSAVPFTWKVIGYCWNTILGIFVWCLCSFSAILFYWLNFYMQKLLEYEIWNYPLQLHEKANFQKSDIGVRYLYFLLI